MSNCSTSPPTPLTRLAGLVRLRERSPLVPAGAPASAPASAPAGAPASARLRGPLYPLIAYCLGGAASEEAALAAVAPSVPAVLATAEAVRRRLWRDHIENAPAGAPRVAAASPGLLAATRRRLAYALGELSTYCGIFAARPAHAAAYRRLCAAVTALREAIQGAGIPPEAWAGAEKMAEKNADADAPKGPTA